MVINVTQYNNFLKALLDNEPVLQRVSVAGEVTNYHNNGESIFFSLKDAFSQMDCFAFADKIPIVSNGCSVVAEGRPVYLKSGKISFTVTSLKTIDNAGEQYQKYLQLKDKLQSMGYFEQATKIDIPRFCFKIGVVSSKIGAVIHDICNVVIRRNKYARIFLYDVRVQGEVAADQIAQGIKYFDSTDVDVIIVARGGGSNEDLSVFNTEVVATAVFNCQKPIVSAVGHETDFTICDFCADVRASTPSVAAQIVTAYDIQQELIDVLNRQYSAIIKKITTLKQNYNQTFLTLHSLVADKINKAKNQIKANLQKYLSLTNECLQKNSYQLANQCQKINYYSPQTSLTGGKAFVTKDGKRVDSAKNLKKGDILKIILIDGEINATVN